MKCLITDANGNELWSDVATATIQAAPPIVITAQPQDQEVQENKVATFTVEATGDGLTYLWYYSDNGGTSFKATSITTPTYSVKITAVRDGRQMKCLIRDANGNELWSDVATATIQATPPIVITAQPQDQEVEENKVATFTVEATGNGLTYLWYYSNNGGASFAATKITTPTYSLKITAERDGRQMKCLIRDANGNELWSEVATATIKANPAIVIEGVTYEALTDSTCMVASYDGTAATLVIPGTVEGMTVTEIGEEAFMNNANLTSIDLPDSITVIRARAFKNCTNLSEMK